jgi:hypothetical protein
MADSKRISVRLNAAQGADLEKLCGETGRDASVVVRRALAAFLRVSPNSPGSTDGPSAPPQHQPPADVPTPATRTDGDLRTVAINETANSKAGPSALSQVRPTEAAKAVAPPPTQPGLTPSLPPGLEELETEARGLGMALRKVRRLQFQRVVAATAVAAESAEELRDGELFIELVRLGRAFGLLPV